MMILFVVLAAAARVSAEAPPAGWSEYESLSRHVSFLYPAGLKAEERAAPDGAFVLELSSSACVVATLEVVKYGASRIDLPKRGSDLFFDPGRNMWLETDLERDEDEDPPREKGPSPVCLSQDRLGAGVVGYRLTDAMHGWSTIVILTDKKTAFVWSNVRRKDVDYCPVDIDPLVREVGLSGGLRAVAAECPPGKSPESRAAKKRRR